MKFTTPFNNGAWAAMGLGLLSQAVSAQDLALSAIPSASGPSLGLAGMVDKPVNPGIPRPMQTFFIPMTEPAIVDKAMKRVQPTAVSGRFVNMIAFAITTDNTIIWYDHWEEGYEADILKPVQPQTRVWGDRNAKNGCAPNVKTCTDANDVLNAGNTIQITEFVDLTKRGGSIFYDGGDMVHASYPITVTRAGYSEKPGSVLAGGVEVYDTEVWGSVYEIPVGENMGLEAFEMTTLFVMAKDSGTQVKFEGLANAVTYNLGKGEQACISVPSFGLRLVSNKPIQVDIVAGDINSSYEMRWFSLQPSDNWSNDYMTPVGDTQGKTRVMLYNPSKTAGVVVTTTTINPLTFVERTNTTLVPAKSWALSPNIPFGSGGRLVGDGKFLALSYTDTDKFAGDRLQTEGNMYDWGLPLVPTNMLTPQVVIGLGYGCTNNNCGTEIARSPVWVTPSENAYIFIDYNNSGIPAQYDVRRVRKLESIRVRSPNSKKDMSGALIFATAWDGSAAIAGANPSGRPIDIASAWGQDPNVSTARQDISMDLGTTVVPFTTIRVTKLTDIKNPETNSFLTYTIRVMNVGQVNVPPGKFKIVDPALDSCDYVANSTRYSIDGGLTKVPVPDDTVGSAFPLDGTGLANMFEMPRRGGTHDISFKVYIDRDKLNKKSITNYGYVDEPLRQRQNFQVTNDILFKADIEIKNTVYLGQNNGAGCSNAGKLILGSKGNDVTYCFEVKNTGSTHLKIKVDNPTLDGYSYSWPTIVKPGDSFTLNAPRGIKGNLTNYAIATGTPVFPNGVEIGIEKPIKQDPSAVQATADLPAIAISNTVITGPLDSAKLTCAAIGGVKIASGDIGQDVTYCFTITNKGNTYLDKIETKNPILDNFLVSYTPNMKPVAPGANFSIPVPKKILRTLNNTATVTGMPVLVDGQPIRDDTGKPLPAVTASDDSGVRQIDSRSGDKDPFTPPGSTGQVTTCMAPHWHDAGSKTPLSCKAKDVYFTNINNRIRLPPCIEGTKVKVDIIADWYFKSARYDPAFFVALDGGDALNGTCLLKGLEQITGPLGMYKVVDPKNNATTVGSVAWNADFRGGNDKCGDVVINSGGDASIKMAVVNTEVICRDRDKDGILDVAVCMSWRVKSTDGVCTLVKSDPATKGLLPDAYPGLPSDCYCDIYNIPDVPVTPIPQGRVDVCL